MVIPALDQAFKIPASFDSSETAGFEFTFINLDMKRSMAFNLCNMGKRDLSHGRTSSTLGFFWPLKAMILSLMSLLVNPLPSSSSMKAGRFISSVGPLHPQHSKWEFVQIALQPPLVIGPRQILFSSNKQRLLFLLHSTHTGLV